MLDNFYHNLQIINGTKLYKKTTILKNEEGQEAIEITSVIMVRQLTSGSDVDRPLEINHRIVGRNMTSRYKFQQKEVDESDPNTTIVTENKSAENSKLIQHFTVAEAIKNQLDQTENPGQKIQEILRQYTNKPKITNIQIIRQKEPTPEQQMTPTKTKNKRRYISESSSEEEKDKKELCRDKSRQSSLEGEMKPEERSLPTGRASRSSYKASSREHTPVRMTTEKIEYRKGPTGKKFPVI